MFSSRMVQVSNDVQRKLGEKRHSYLIVGLLSGLKEQNLITLRKRQAFAFILCNINLWIPHIQQGSNYFETIVTHIFKIIILSTCPCIIVSDDANCSFLFV